MEKCFVCPSKLDGKKKIPIGDGMHVCSPECLQKARDEGVVTAA